MATTAAASSDVHSLAVDQTVLDEVLYTQVTDLLTVHIESQRQMSAFNAVPDFELTGTLEMQCTSVFNQMITLRNRCEKTALTSTYPHWRPRVMTAGLQTAGLYCLRMALPNDKCNLWSLQLVRSRRTASHWEDFTGPEAPGLTGATLALSMSSTALRLSI
jgi:hypothetical protein